VCCAHESTRQQLDVESQTGIEAVKAFLLCRQQSNSSVPIPAEDLPGDEPVA